MHSIDQKWSFKLSIHQNIQKKTQFPQRKINFLFVTYTIIQSITSSEMCSLHLTHPSAHTHTHTHTHPEQWAVDTVAPGQQLGVRCLAQGSHFSRRHSCRSWDSNPKPWVTSQTLYPLGHDCLFMCEILSNTTVFNIDNKTCCLSSKSAC